MCQYPPSNPAKHFSLAYIQANNTVRIGSQNTENEYPTEYPTLYPTVKSPQNEKSKLDIHIHKIKTPNGDMPHR